MRDCEYCQATKEYEDSLPKHIDIVFDGPPSHEGGRFVEVENDGGHSIRFGEWVKRDDGYWALRFNPRNPLPIVKGDAGDAIEAIRSDLRSIVGPTGDGR